MATSINVSDRVKIITPEYEGKTGTVEQIWQGSLYIKVDDIHGGYNMVIAKSKAVKIRKKKSK